MSRIFKAVLGGLLLGVISAGVAVLERDAFVPYSAVGAVVFTVTIVIFAAVLAFSRRRRPLAKLLFVAALAFFACFYTAMTIIRK